MEKVNNALSAVQSFLNQAQNMGLLKSFSMVFSDTVNSDLTKFDELLREFSGAIRNITEIVSDDEKPSVVQEKSDSREMIDVESEDLLNIPETTNKNLVQIQVDESEIQRRISAFISRKRKEVDEWNVQEFCSRPYLEEQHPLYEQVDSCARVDTVFIPRFGSKSHVKVSKVENRWGPQTQPRIDAKKIKKEPGTEAIEQPDVSLETIQERLQNMESHLKLKSESSIRCSIFQRLKDLEDRILFLEGISPDYFHSSGPAYCSPKKKSDSEKEKLYSNWSVDDLQKRIQSLRDSLKTKSIQLKKD